MYINNMFYSIQGEGKYMGTPVVFVRTAGCSVKCSFCDQKDAWKRGRLYKPEDVLSAVRRLSYNTLKTIVITGGEPTEQDDLYYTTSLLRDEGFRVHLETSGINDIPHGYFNHVVCSPKENIGYKVCKGADELKYVVSWDIAKRIYKIVNASTLAQYAGRIWLQPLDNAMDNMRACYELAMRDPRFRVGIQLHKVVGVE